MAKCDGVDSPAKVDGVATPAKVDGVTFTYGTVYWNVTGVTEPQHYWPFSETGDYTDQGATGGLDLTAQGSGNSFSADGLVLNGSGYATVGHNDDVGDLGATYSILIDVIRTGGLTCAPYGGTDAYSTNTGGVGVNFWAGNNIVHYHNSSTVYKASDAGLFPSGTYQVVYTYSGGSATLYINGSYNASGSGAIATPTHFTANFAIGAINAGGGYKFVGTIRRVGVLKGTAWSADDVAAIYAALP